ncbi:MAG: transposase [Sphingopyxis sp.]|nr:transposase [Sphingopyxis sp.]
MRHVAARSDWSDDAVPAAVRAHLLPIISQRGPSRALIIDDTGIPKQGRRSVGVTRRFCGQLGKQDKRQVVVRLAAANDHAGLPIAGIRRMNGATNPKNHSGRNARRELRQAGHIEAVKQGQEDEWITLPFLIDHIVDVPLRVEPSKPR